MSLGVPDDFDERKCPICNHQATTYLRDATLESFRVVCPRCGRFEISADAALSDLSEFGARYLLSGAIRNMSERVERVSLDLFSLAHLLEDTRIPRGPFEMIDVLLQYVGRRTSGPGDLVQLQDVVDYPVLFLEDRHQFSFIVTKAIELGYLEYQKTEMAYCLGLQGWGRLEELHRAGVQSNRAFVAMWFATETDDAYSEGIHPALITCGYTAPFRVDKREHNDKIDDIIIAEIRKSGLLVADFTNHRQGVYFEAGLAMGLGIPVIWTCRKDYMTDEEGKRPHFDTRQYNHIVWETPEQLHERLVARIQATIPGRAMLPTA
ncbi:MAG TPA: hypothetical protein VK610_02040 [Rhodothermales bacterium]|nr:hypothetical protein [Rhodothermales bacterium]